MQKLKQVGKNNIAMERLQAMKEKGLWSKKSKTAVYSRIEKLTENLSLTENLNTEIV